MVLEAHRVRALPSQLAQINFLPGPSISTSLHSMQLGWPQVGDITICRANIVADEVTVMRKKAMSFEARTNLWSKDFLPDLSFLHVSLS